MKAKTTVLKHIKFAALVIGLMGSWAVAVVWLATINQ